MKGTSVAALTISTSTVFPIDGGWSSVNPNATVEVFYCWGPGPAHAGHPRWRPGDFDLGKPADVTQISMLAVDEHGKAAPAQSAEADGFVDTAQALNLTVVGAVPLSLRVPVRPAASSAAILGWQGFITGPCAYSITDTAANTDGGGILSPGLIGPPLFGSLTPGRFLNLSAEVTMLLSVAPVLAR